MRRILIGLAVVAAAFLAMTAVAFIIGMHLRHENVTKCLGNDPAGCTALIQSRYESTADLAIDYYNRANIYGGKGLNDEAIADYTKAIALRPDIVCLLHTV